MKIINKNHWKRNSHYNFFSGMGYPHLNMCFDVDITATRNFAKDQGIKLNNLILYFSSSAANQIPEMKTRIRDGEVVEHEIVHPAFTVMGENNVFNYCNAEFDYDTLRFFQEVDENMRKIILSDHLVFDDRDDFLYITSIPWIKFTSIQHPIHLNRNDSIPRLSWGRFANTNDQWWMPYSLQVHHGLADGYHVGLFYDTFQEILNKPEAHVTLS
jgi:chloramphenicol O-acetyltransferase type A